MVPVPSVADEDGRRPGRERQDLIDERLALTNGIDGLLATLGISGYRPLRRDRRARLEDLRGPEGAPLPANAKARLRRTLDRLELVMGQIAELEKARNAVVFAAGITKESAANEAEVMIRQLVELKAIGPELATLLVWEAYVRPFRSGKALGSYAGPRRCHSGTPFRSGGLNREPGISKDGNRRLRKAMVELAWLWLRWQPDSELSRWYRQRTREAGARLRKVAAAMVELAWLWRASCWWSCGATAARASSPRRRRSSRRPRRKPPRPGNDPKSRKRPEEPETRRLDPKTGFPRNPSLAVHRRNPRTR